MSASTVASPVYVGVGSNQNNPLRQVEAAVIQLGELRDTQVQRVSGCYRNPPMGPPDQPDYVNAVVALLTSVDPHRFLNELQGIERRLGRDRSNVVHWGPRCIDLDILIYGDRQIDADGLTIPHPGISQRNFVLFPLLEIAPELEVPGLGSVRRLASMVDGSTLEKLPTQ